MRDEDKLVACADERISGLFVADADDVFLRFIQLDAQRHIVSIVANHAKDIDRWNTEKNFHSIHNQAHISGVFSMGEVGLMP